MKKILQLLLSLFFVFSSLFSLHAQTITFPGLTGFYPLDQSNGSSLVMDDVIGNNNIEVLNGAGFSSDRKGASNGAADIGGATNFSNVFRINKDFNKASINALDQFTIAFWYRRNENTTYTGNSFLLSIQGQSDGREYRFQIPTATYKPELVNFYNSTVTSFSITGVNSILPSLR